MAVAIYNESWILSYFVLTGYIYTHDKWVLGAEEGAELVAEQGETLKAGPPVFDDCIVAARHHQFLIDFEQSSTPSISV